MLTGTNTSKGNASFAHNDVCLQTDPPRSIPELHSIVLGACIRIDKPCVYQRGRRYSPAMFDLRCAFFILRITGRVFIGEPCLLACREVLQYIDFAAYTGRAIQSLRAGARKQLTVSPLISSCSRGPVLRTSSTQGGLYVHIHVHVCVVI